MEIYGINNNGKIVIHATKSLGNIDITFPTLIKKWKETVKSKDFIGSI